MAADNSSRATTGRVSLPWRPKVSDARDRRAFSGQVEPLEPRSMLSTVPTLFYAAADGTHGVELWATTSCGTALVKDIDPGASSSSPAWTVNMGGKLYFEANDGTHGIQLWESNGTSAGTSMVAQIGSNGGAFQPYSTSLSFGGGEPLVVVGSELMFSATAPGYGFELWKSDGTSSGTVLVDDIWPGGKQCGTIGESLPNDLTNVNGTLFFTANDGTHGIQLWKSDGSCSGTQMIKEINNSGNAFPSPYGNGDGFTAIGGNLFFVANDGTHGRQLWVSNGTTAGTQMLSNFGTTAMFGGHSGAINFAGDSTMVAVGSELLFVASVNVNSPQQLWESNGTVNGTQLVSNQSFLPDNLYNANGTLYFTAANSGNGAEPHDLWKSDGTSAGTVMIDSITSNTSPYPGDFVLYNGNVYFSAAENAGEPSMENFEFYKTNGTSAGTQLVKEIDTGGNNFDGSFPTDFTVFNGLLYFSASDATYGDELWSSNGTSAGTTMAADIYNNGAAFVTILEYTSDPIYPAYAFDQFAAVNVLTSVVVANAPGKLAADQAGFEFGAGWSALPTVEQSPAEPSLDKDGASQTKVAFDAPAVWLGGSVSPSRALNPSADDVPDNIASRTPPRDQERGGTIVIGGFWWKPASKEREG